MAIDGGDYSWRALEYACSLVKMSGGSLLIMTVAPKNAPVPVLLAAGDCMTAQIGNEVLDAARSIMSGHDISCSYLLECGGKIPELILRAEKAENCDAIVLGSRGLSGIAEFFLGSVSSKVAQYAGVPVLIVK